jgi:DNA-binding MarR family transcriptional regulator
MSEPIQEIAELDRLIHEASRLAIMTALSACRSADFLYLERITGLTKGNLSSHLSKLEEGGLVVITKQFVGKKPCTTIALTKHGTQAIESHWQKLAELRKRTRKPRT